MCLITNYLTRLFSGFLNEKTACIGGLILIIIGIANLLKKDAPLKQNNFLQYFSAGFAVGLDGAFANRTLRCIIVYLRFHKSFSADKDNDGFCGRHSDKH